MYLETIKSNFLDKNNKISSSRLLWFFRKNPIEKQNLIKLTEKCIGDEHFAVRTFRIENDLSNYLICANPNCSNFLKGVTRWESKKTNTLWTKDNHRVTCSNKCKHELHSSRTEEVNKNRIATFQNKYNVDSAAQLETNIFKVNNPMKNAKTVSKMKATCLKKYGVDNASKSNAVIDKIKEKANRPLAEQLMINEKRKNTCLKKYGVNYTSQVSSIFEKIQRSSFKRKDYIWGNGEISSVQGYEPIVLKELEEKGYKYEDVFTSPKDMPEIIYKVDDCPHRYYPDIFIPKDNIIIEVKSDYTVKCNLEINEAKFEATKALGFDFRLEVR